MIIKLHDRVVYLRIVKRVWDLDESDNGGATGTGGIGATWREGETVVVWKDMFGGVDGVKVFGGA